VLPPGTSRGRPLISGGTVKVSLDGRHLWGVSSRHLAREGFPGSHNRYARRASGAQSIALLEQLRDDETVPPAVRAMAANSLLDRGFGRPPQAFEVNANVNTVVVPKERARDVLASRIGCNA
jgi:hypothetical protein